jgi:hypothetical protein
MEEGEAVVQRTTQRGGSSVRCCCWKIRCDAMRWAATESQRIERQGEVTKHEKTNKRCKAIDMLCVYYLSGFDCSLFFPPAWSSPQRGLTDAANSKNVERDPATATRLSTPGCRQLRHSVEGPVSIPVDTRLAVSAASRLLGRSSAFQPAPRCSPSSSSSDDRAPLDLRHRPYRDRRFLQDQDRRLDGVRQRPVVTQSGGLSRLDQRPPQRQQATAEDQLHTGRPPPPAM